MNNEKSRLKLSPISNTEQYTNFHVEAHRLIRQHGRQSKNLFDQYSDWSAVISPLTYYQQTYIPNMNTFVIGFLFLKKILGFCVFSFQMFLKGRGNYVLFYFAQIENL